MEMFSTPIKSCKNGNLPVQFLSPPPICEFFWVKMDTLCGKGFQTYAERSAVTVCARGGHVLGCRATIPTSQAWLPESAAVLVCRHRPAVPLLISPDDPLFLLAVALLATWARRAWCSSRVRISKTWTYSFKDKEAYYLVGTRLSGKNLGMIGHFSWLGARFWNAALAAKIWKPDISSVQETALSGILYEFFGVFILAKTRCLELVTNNLLTRTHS